jgi:probable HAF family extracellular repeat protein
LSLSAAAINDAGQVVGSAWIDDVSHAVLWQGGVMIVLGYGAANDINDSGQVVGDSAAAWGFIWTPTSPNGTTGTLNFLEPLPGMYGDSASSALGVNDAGQVVGTSFSWSPGGPEAGGSEYKQATLWVGGEPRGLNQLVVPPSGGLGTAVAISDSGQIIGDMFGWSFTPSGRPYLLTPITVPLITISDATVTEGNTGVRAASFTVSLSEAPSQPVTVAYATANGTATEGADFQAASGTVTFASGQTRRTVTVLVNGDRLGEPNETFVVSLSSPTSAVIADSQGVGTILDDEPRISISDVTKREGRRNKTTLFTFTVTLSAGYDQPVTMSFATANGTATTSDGDYVAKSGTLTFAPGETTKTITIEVKGDAKKEANEIFYLDLFGLSSNALFTKNRGIGTILNDD